MAAFVDSMISRRVIVVDYEVVYE